MENLNEKFLQQKYYMIEDVQVLRFNNISINNKNSIDINGFKNHIYKIKVLNLPSGCEYRISTNINNQHTLSDLSIDGVLEINNITNKAFFIQNNSKDKLAIYEKENKIQLNKSLNFTNLSNVKLYFDNDDPVNLKQCIIIAFAYSLFRTY